LVSRTVSTHVIAYLLNAVMRGTHEGAYTFVIGNVEDINNGLDVLKTHRLRTCLLLRHMVYTEKLIVTE
jgi:hypothetical protein